MLRNLVEESANNPGAGLEVNLGGAPQGRRSFAQSFTNGQTPFYFITDGVQTECGTGTFVAGSPHKLQRTSVIWNSAGTAPARLNFTGAVRVYNEVPAELLTDEWVQPTPWSGNVGVTATTDFLGGALPARTKQVLIIGSAQVFGNGGAEQRSAEFSAMIRNANDTADAIAIGSIGAQLLMPGQQATVPLYAHYQLASPLAALAPLRFRAASSTGETVQLYNYKVSILCRKG